MAPIPPVIAAAGAATAKVVVQGAVFAASTVAAVAGVNALTGKGDNDQQNVTALLAHLEQKEQHQNAFFLFDFEGGTGYFAVAAMIILIMVTCCGVAHCCNITPMARQRIMTEQARHQAHGQLMTLLTSQRSGRRTSLISVRQNIQTASPCGKTEPSTPREPGPSTHPGRVEDGAGTWRRESSVIPEDDTTEV